MESHTPVVSVITATRNRPRLLQEALHSIKAQSFEDFEVLVVDDGSDPETHEQYRRIWTDLDDRFVLLQRSPVGGPGSDPGSGRNFGLRQARGHLVAFLDHDDFWITPDHLAVGVDALSRHGADYYFTHVRFEPPHDDLMWAVPPSRLTRQPLLSSAPDVHEVSLAVFADVMSRCHVHPSHTMARREVVVAAGGFIEGLRTADDVNLMLRLADRSRRIAYRPHPSVAIRLPEGRSYSLASSTLDQALSEHHAVLDARVRCLTRPIRKCARSREAWVKRQLSRQLAPRSGVDACRLCLQAVVTTPTLGTMWQLGRAVVQTAVRRPW